MIKRNSFTSNTDGSDLGSSKENAESRRHSPPSISFSGESLSCTDEEYTKLEHQVAGHKFVKGKETIGLLKTSRGTILKPCSKAAVGEREVAFYETLKSSALPALVQLQEFAPVYHGTKTILVNGQPVQFIELQDVCVGMSEPCIMDIKIGKRTWDPMASEKKIANEKIKYSRCKEEVSFCIPGFQVYRIKENELKKFDKEYGKKLVKETVLESLRTFLNGDLECGVHRGLLLPLLTSLRRVQNWAAQQNVVELYCTSLLIAYDAAVLRDKLHSKEGMVSEDWCRVKIIDLAHAFITETGNQRQAAAGEQANVPADLNYLEGINSLVDILQSFQ